MSDIHAARAGEQPCAAIDANPTYAAFAARSAGPDASIATVESLPTLLNGRYRLERLLGLGGMSAVYCAEDRVRARFERHVSRVAIKVMNECHARYPDANALLYKEFALNRLLHHPGIIRLHDFDLDSQSGRGFISMEYLQGTPLDRMLVEHPQGLAWDLLQPIAVRVLEAVAHMHASNVVHGDLKPSNFMLEADGLRLFDFGLSESTHPQVIDLPRLQRQRIVAWTPRYAALELVEGGVPSCASDIYSAACMLYELATGNLPYRGCDARQAQVQRLDKSISRARNLPQSTWRALHLAMALDPHTRRIGAQELLNAFRSGIDRQWPGWIGRLVSPAK
ncbi:serine/threonine-protein kinase [Pseudomonas sp. 148P]|uniref:Serine/threonine-protein kinase n=1 Tax=Pseudomonas ulcerans TaxID=3115852 RepID=A0ABU7HUN0_9PSED|nr:MULTISPECIES: serine/threonine-protein kinase [unclassified Pseudomonas]MEE1924033.1 serine/threonine-protein kinase [Pseudomonas sp. 147P]MEE1935204.1 serine/threonine-protein kinase [Pseudomonas sp. 148P]